MAIIGLQKLVFAPNATDGTSSTFPTHTANSGFSVGSIASIDIKLNNAEGELYGDDVLQEYVSEFTSADITAELCEITLANQKKIYGLTEGESTSQGEYYDGINDTAPYGSLGGIQVLTTNGTKSFRVYIFHKVKGVKPDETGSTKGSSVSFGTHTAKFKATAPACGKWRTRKDFDSASAAETYLNTQLAVGT